MYQSQLLLQQSYCYLAKPSWAVDFPLSIFYKNDTLITDFMRRHEQKILRTCYKSVVLAHFQRMLDWLPLHPILQTRDGQWVRIKLVLQAHIAHMLALLVKWWRNGIQKPLHTLIHCLWYVGIILGLDDVLTVSQDGGLYCDSNGKISKPFSNQPYCVSGTGTVGVVNSCGGSVSFCQTVLPGNEAMLIPTSVDGSSQLAVPGTSYWCETAAQWVLNVILWFR